MNKFGTTLKNHLLTGISYVFPVLVVAAVSQRLMTLAQGTGGISGQVPTTFVNTLVDLNQTIGELSLSLVFPILAGFIAFSIVDKIGLVPGMVGGLMVTSSQTGFIGAILMGFLVGYLCLGLKQLKIPQAISSMMPVFIIPVFGTAVAILLFQAIVLPLEAFNLWGMASLEMLPLIGKVLGALIIGGMISYDIGGPINKLGMIISFGLLTSGSYFGNTAAQIAIIIPPLGSAVATFIAKQTYSRDLQEAGKRAWWLGLTGISEGAIPFRLENPQAQTWINVCGGALGAGLAVALGAVNQLPLSGFYAWPFVENSGSYLLGIAFGAIVVSGLSLIGRQPVSQEVVEEAFDEDEWDD